MTEHAVISTKQNWAYLCAGPVLKKRASIGVERHRRRSRSSRSRATRISAKTRRDESDCSKQNRKRYIQSACFVFHILPKELRRLRLVANVSNISEDEERIRLERIPSDAMRYMCPVCLAEGSNPRSVTHNVDCPYLKRRDDR